jgi:hypothetical protein
LALERLDALVADDPLCVHETGLDIFRLEPGVTFEDGLRGITRREHAEDVLNR